jgi:hypothetical protein
MAAAEVRIVTSRAAAIIARRVRKRERMEVSSVSGRNR